MAIAFGAFAMVFAELLLVGLLSGISRDLQVREGTVGMIVSITALLAFVAALATALAAGRMDRRLVLIGPTLLTIVSSVMSALAPNFIVLFAARLVPADKAHVSSTAVMSGISIAATLMSVIVLVPQMVYLPKIIMDEHVIPGDLAGVLKSPRNVAALAVLACAVAGHYAGYIDIAPYLSRVTRIETTLLSTLLFVYGLFSIGGNFLGGGLAARNLHGTVLGNMAVFQAAISLGSFVGGLAVNGVGVRSAMWLGAGIVGLGIAIVAVVGWIDRRGGQARP